MLSAESSQTLNKNVIKKIALILVKEDYPWSNQLSSNYLKEMLPLDIA